MEAHDDGLFLLIRLHVLYSLDGLPWNINVYDPKTSFWHTNTFFDTFNLNVLENPSTEIVCPGININQRI